jgi:hypothetical protein
MEKAGLIGCLKRELEEWSKKPYSTLIAELHDEVVYERGDGANLCQVEVLLLESTPDYVHVSVAVDDGSFKRFISPLSTSFLVHSDGRRDVAKPSTLCAGPCRRTAAWS